MNPLICLTALFATAIAAPSNYAAVVPGAVGVVAAAPTLGVVPPPYTTAKVAGPGSTTIQQAPAQVSKQVHYGQTTYVANIHKEIIKPPTPHFPIAVPTALRGTVQVNPAVINTVKETHVVNEPVPVEKRIEVPYDVPIYEDVIREIPQPYAVAKPYEVPVPTPVVGETIFRHVQTAPAIEHSHTALVAPRPVAVAGYSAPPTAFAGYASAPVAHGGYAAAPALGYAAGYGYAAASAPAIAPASVAGYGYAPAYGYAHTGYGYGLGHPGYAVAPAGVVAAPAQD